MAAGLLVLAPGLAPGALAQEDETRVITDAVGDGGALPDLSQQAAPTLPWTSSKSRSPTWLALAPF